MPTLLQTGFRPFFLAAAGFAALIVPLWALVWAGSLPPPSALPGPVWHAHEMLLGFTSAVVAGFLLTAVRSWTGRPTLSGAALGLLVAVWLAGRVLAFVPSPPVVAGAVDAAFFLGLAVGVGRPLVAARDRRNLGFLVPILLLAALDLAVHAAPANGLLLLRGALDLVVGILVVITARIVPMFTANALPGAVVTRRPRLDRTALGAVVSVLVGELLGVDGLVVVGGIVGGLAVLVRGAGWAPGAAARVPLLAILHLGHAWVGIGLLLRAATAAGLPVPASAATHALAVGAIGCSTLGMMARVSLGHTGRPLVAGRSTRLAFLLIASAALVRVGATLSSSTGPITAAGLLFGLAFAAWIVTDGRYLVEPRVDGRPG